MSRNLPEMRIVSGGGAGNRRFRRTVTGGIRRILGPAVGLIIRWRPVSEQPGVVRIDAEVVSRRCKALHERKYPRAEKVFLELATGRGPAQIDHVVQGRFDAADLSAHVMSQVDGIEKPQAVVDQDADIPVQSADHFEPFYLESSHDGISDRAQHVETQPGIFPGTGNPIGSYG